MKLTENFELKEFIESRFYNKSNQKKVWVTFNQNKEFLLPNVRKLAEQLQVLRDYIDKPVHINISYRPAWWERLKGRSGKSLHTKGMAADIKVNGMSTSELKQIIEHLIDSGKMMQGGVGLYPTFIHYDIRNTKTRW